MLFKRIRLFLIFILFSAILYGSGENFTIEKGDILSIEVMEHPEFSRSQVMVLPDGYIQYPILGSIEVAGTTASKLADTIEKSLEGKYVVNPIVTVYINKIKNQSVNIFGYVNRPGRHEVFRPIDLMTALSIAGGVKNMKKVTKIIINRANGEVEILKARRKFRKSEYSFKEVRRLKPGDTIVVEHKDIEWGKYSFFTTVGYTILRIITLLIQ